MMEVQPEKVYLAVGKDFQEGIGNLDWIFKNWASQAISIVILHVSNNSKDFVETPFGKLPTSSVNDGKVEAFRMCKEEKTDKHLSKYMAYCYGKAKAEILKIENSEEPVHKVILKLITKLRMTKLVMGISSSKSVSRNSRNGVSGSIYVRKHKPDSCELFLVCKGRLVLLRDGGDEGLSDMKEKGGFKVWWWGKSLTDNAANCVGSNSERGYSRQVLSSLTTIEGHEKWENCVGEIEDYFNFLSIRNLESSEGTEDEAGSGPDNIESPEQENLDPNLSFLDKIEVLKARLEETKRSTEKNRNEAKANQERRERAEWAISLCHKRSEELEALTNEETTKQIELQTSLDTQREHLEEAANDFEEHKNRMRSLKELEGELMSKLQASSLEKLQAEAQLDNAMRARTDAQRQIEEIRRQRDDLRRKVSFRKMRKAIGTPNMLSYSYREFTEQELREATENFSERMKVGFGANGVVYRGRLNHTTFAIKLQNSFNAQSREEFQAEIDLLREIRHPHLINMIGACTEKNCIVLEYMHNGSLQDHLNSTTTTTTSKNNSLPWFARVRIATEICSGLVFLHTTKPKPTVHCDLKPSNVLLDRNFVAKIADFGLAHHLLHDFTYSKTTYGDSELKGTIHYMDPDYIRTGELTPRSDVYSLGIIMLQLLTGKPAVGLARRVRTALDYEDLDGIIDKTAGNWPADQAMEFAEIAMRCASFSRRGRPDAHPTVMRELDMLRERAMEAAEAVRAGGGGCNGERMGGEGEGERDVPSVFLCPIFQEIMKEPHVAADGFSYELEAIQAWLGGGHETSPMTNLKLTHKLLTPNHTLRSLISDWQNISRSQQG